MSAPLPPHMRPFPWDGKGLDGRPNVAKATAIRAVIEGRADEEQQKMAMRCIIEELCGAYDLSFTPGPDGDRITAFAEGKRHVASEIIKTTRLNYEVILKEANNG